MSRYLGLVALFLFGTAPAAIGQDARDAVAVDPDHHHVILENDHVRVFEAMAATHDTSPMHTHPPLVLISLDKARARIAAPDGASAIFDLHPAQVEWLENVEHAWEILAGQVNLIGVEIKAARGGQAPPAIVPDPREALVADPAHHLVVLENDHVRVFEAQAATGDTSPMHTHPPTLLVSLGTVRMQLTLPDGSSPVIDLHPGQVLWIEDVEHSWQVLAGQTHVIGVEVKAAR